MSKIKGSELKEILEEIKSLKKELAEIKKSKSSGDRKCYKCSGPWPGCGCGKKCRSCSGSYPKCGCKAVGSKNANVQLKSENDNGLQEK